MAVEKKFKCSNFDPTSGCAYMTSGDEESVINEADSHLITEHGYQDSPSLRQQIKDSLVEA